MEHIIARIHWIRYLKLEEQEWSLGAAVSSSLFPGLQGGCIFYIIEDYLRCYFETWIVCEKSFEHGYFLSRHQRFVAQAVG